jgi:AcrR family transcriptional regulator
VLAIRRKRIIDALASACMEKGYAATTMADVVKFAGISRQSLYDEFPNKDAIAVATLEAAYANLFETLTTSCTDAEGIEAIEAGLAAVLGWVEINAPVAWVCFVERFDLPPASRAQAEATDRLIAMLGAHAPPDPKRPEFVDEMVVGGAETLVRYRLVAGEGGTASAMLPSLLSFVRQPYEAGWT